MQVVFQAFLSHPLNFVEALQRARDKPYFVRPTVVVPRDYVNDRIAARWYLAALSDPGVDDDLLAAIETHVSVDDYCLITVATTPCQDDAWVQAIRTVAERTDNRDVLAWIEHRLVGKAA